MASDGYSRNQRIENERLRMLTFTIAKPYLKDESATVYDFWPMDEDPTPEEKQQMDNERLEKEMQEAAEARERILKKYKQRNGGL